MTTYDIQNYLLDRANIHDTVTKMSMYLDMSRIEALKKEVFHTKVLVDYTSMFSGEPKLVNGEEQVDSWAKQISKMDSWQHVTTGILIELPQPGAGVDVPETATVLANCTVNLSRKGAKGDSDTRNGGRYHIELTRTNQAGNPWRISKLKADLVWAAGNWDVYSAMD
ncbi:NTF2-like protein [Glarea lozoyensis ATCC 20868]|uniref:NTF2-like protein n=1 Tax=Glarea lozoyensis (strain ATCC 20868 / MF5171) TaxID=1116229 RepID=S3CSN0_GLAL2|nr:NTF2-like protein [Glarea lozoyensis ATCC 20868]EPE28079.1 NTF2-like protein [Glarea lozoyensis ATCC 20868]